MQPSFTGSSPQQQRQTGSCIASLLLIGQDATGPSLRSANQAKQQAKAERALVPGRAYRQPELSASHQPSVLEHSHPDAAVVTPPGAIAFEDTQAVKTPTEVKQEMRAGYDMEDACMDTQVAGEEQEVDPCDQGGEELDISFDSQFPDLMSDLITEEAPPVADPPNAAAAASHPGVFPMGVRYMVPPQPSPSSSFLPFPHPLPPSSSSGLASITDFSPEWSYPEVTYEHM